MLLIYLRGCSSLQRLVARLWSYFLDHSIQYLLTPDNMASTSHSLHMGLVDALQLNQRSIGNTKTRFISGQSAGQEVIDYSYTDNPFKLMFWDVYYFFKYAKFLPNIVIPLLPTSSGDMCELALTWGNLHCLFVHSILIVLQLGFLLVVPPMAVLLPLWVTVLSVAAFFVVNQGLCRILNGSSGLIFESEPDFAHEDQDKFVSEKWFFLNGVAVGEHWLQNALNRLALTFGRQVTGIHNPTSGIIFDTIECLIQRNFTYATSDIRAAHREVKEALLCAELSRVVFILHSQGGIEGGMVLDWLLQELPQDLMGKLEIYTFGNAANHFNNPYTSAQALATGTRQKLFESTDANGAFGFVPNDHSRDVGPEKEEPSLFSSFLRHQQPPSPPHSPLFNIKPHHHHYERSQPRRSVTTTSPHLQEVTRPGGPSSDSHNNRARVVKYIEHYAFTTDFVAVWGVLHFATAKLANNTIPKFIGRLFARTDPAHRGGHQFVQHYLDGMFPLERDSSGKFIGCKETNAFMESEVFLDDNDFLKREGLLKCMHGCPDEDDTIKDAHGDLVVRNGQGVVKSRNGRGRVTEEVKVKRLSRLWHYRNGKIPPALGDQVFTTGADGQVDALMVKAH